MTEARTTFDRDDLDNGDDAASDQRWIRLADDLELAPRAAPLRRWVQSPNAGHLSGLVWGAPKSNVVLVHDLGDSSNGWDGVAIASRHDLVALDLAGHGRSSAAKNVASPARQSPALIDAIRSLAPAASLVVASGLGAAIALQAAVKRPATVRALLVVDGGVVASGAGPLIDPDGFADVDEVTQRLAAAAPRRPRALVRHMAAEATAVNAAGRREWRYQLGETPAEFDAWTKVEQFSDLPIPLAVVTADPGAASDPLVRSILGRWPHTQCFVIDGPAEDLIGASPVPVAEAIDAFVSQLTGAS